MKIIYSIILFFSITNVVVAQFDPPAGQAGSKALYKDSNIFVAWATGCTISRGWQNIADISLGKATVGNSSSIVGIADNYVLSLGDGGSMIVNFASPIFNGNGPDFAIFENGLNDGYLELAFIEVSSDGIAYYRFPAVSNSDTITQYDNAGQLDATKLNNLACKYRAGFGTPFDLEELKTMQGLNVNAIKYIKLIDVVGSLNDSFCSRDSRGVKINDPWPTPFASGGFDVDAIGVIHDLNHTDIEKSNANHTISIYPNPASNYIYIEQSGKMQFFNIFDMEGKEIKKIQSSNATSVDISELKSGIYYLQFSDELDVYISKLIKL